MKTLSNTTAQSILGGIRYRSFGMDTILQIKEKMSGNNLATKPLSDKGKANNSKFERR